MPVIMEFLVVGCGSIGERHIMNLKQVVPHSTIDAYDSSHERLDKVQQKYSINKVDQSIIDSKKYDCVLVCTPPVSHVEIAIRALQAGSNVFIEKPLSNSLRNVQKLQRLAARKKLLVFVGYNFRFNKGINTIKKILDEHKLGKILHVSAYYGQYLPDWRPWQDYKKSYTARKKLGGGIIHDGSHEIDYLVWLLGRPSHMQSQFAFTDTLSTDTEAMADILLRFDKNALGYIHLDFVRREYKRTLEVLCENGIVQWSLSEGVVKLLNASDKAWSTLQLNESINDMYVQEIKHVILCMEKHRRSEIIDIENGISSLKLSELAHKHGSYERKRKANL
jgi:predicted dehydrogenase